MKVIIAGGRNYILTTADRERLDALRVAHGITEVVSGCASGADRGGEDWAIARGIDVKPFPAAWANLSHPDCILKCRRTGEFYDARAGFRRNEQMAQYADACVLFPGGAGTADMARRAAAHRLQLFDWR